MAHPPAVTKKPLTRSSAMEQAIRRPSVGCIEIPKVQTEHRALKKTNSSAPGAQPRADTALTRCAPDIACVRRTKVKERCVCLAVNGGSLSELVFQWYLDNTHRPGNRLVLIHVLEEIHTNLFPDMHGSDIPDEINRTSSSVESEYQRSLQNSAELKTRLSTKLNKLGVSFKFVARYGQPARIIVTVVQEEDADLVVVGYQVQGRLQRLLSGGSIANHVTKHAHCPVLVCRHKMKQKPTGWSDDDDDFRERRRDSERRGRRSKPRATWETLTDDFDYLPPLNENTALVNSHDIEAPVAPVSARAAAGTSIPANNYFQRMVTSVHPYTYSRQLNPPAQRFTEPGPPIFRSGRLGAPWRHIRQCTGNRGDHICFIDGVVKTEDMQRYPPFGYLASVKPASYMPASYAKRPGGPLSASAGSLNQFREHAKQGFKYWYEEKTPMAERMLPKRTIQGRLMRLGVGH